MARDYTSTAHTVNTGSRTGTTLRTISAWFYIDAYDSTARRLFDQGTQEYLYYRTTNGDFAFTVDAWSGSNARWGITQPSAGGWHHLAITYDAGSTANDPVFWLDGTSVSVVEITAPSGTYSNKTSNCYIGNRSDATRGHNGAIGEFAQWDVILSDSEIAALASRVSAARVRPQSLTLFDAGHNAADMVNGGTFTVSVAGYVDHCPTGFPFALDDFVPHSVAAGGGTNLIIQDSIHGHSADNVDLTQLHQLTVQDSTHAQSSDNINLTQLHILNVDESAHSLASDNIDLTQDQQLVVEDSSHLLSSDNIDLTQDHQLTVQDSAHGHAADNLALTQDHQLTIQDSTHGHTADNVVLSVAGILILQDGQHSHSADNIDLTQDHQLAIQDSLHSQVSDNVDLTQDHQLSINDSAHGHVVDNVILSVATILGINDASHAQTVEALTLTQDHQLAIQEALHAHSGESIALTQNHALIISDALHGLISDNVTLTIPSGAVTPSERIYQIKTDDRVYLVAAESRIYTIH